MDTPDEVMKEPRPELTPKARRAVRIIYFTMVVMILLPVAAAWFTGALSFWHE